MFHSQSWVKKTESLVNYIIPVVWVRRVLVMMTQFIQHAKKPEFLELSPTKYVETMINLTIFQNDINNIDWSNVFKCRTLPEQSISFSKILLLALLWRSQQSLSNRWGWFLSSVIRRLSALTELNTPRVLVQSFYNLAWSSIWPRSSN